MFRRILWLLFLFADMMLIRSHAFALDVIAFKGSPKINICPYLQVLEDPDGKMDLVQILHPDIQNRFVPVNSKQLNLGVTRSTYWLRVNLKIIQPDKTPADGNTSDDAWLLTIDRAWMPVLKLWVPVKPETAQTQAQRWRQLSAVTADKSKKILLLNRNSIFFIPPDVDESRPLFLQMASWGPPLNISLHLTQMKEYRNEMTLDFFIFGIIYGLMGAMILYNAFIYLSLRNRTYLLYVLYMAAGFMYLSTSIGHMLAITGVSPRHIFFFLYTISGLSVFFAAWFCRSFLSTSHHAPFIDKILIAHMAVSVLYILLAISGFYYLTQMLSSFAGVIFPLTAIAAGLVCFLKGFRPAGYFLAAWSVLSIGILIWALRGLGILPQTQLITYFFPGAVGLESLLLSLALADRIRILQKEKDQLKIRERRLLTLSNTDSLTKLYNKRYFNEKLKNEISMSENLDNTLSLLMLDLDDFKKVNDMYGHQAGDQVLKYLGKIIRQSVRENDCACRYGGEEFVLILPGTVKETAREVAERIRQTMQNAAFKGQDGSSFLVTVSIGLAQHHRDENSEDLIKRTDQTLYQAKNQGKNQTAG